MLKRKVIRVNKADYERVLLTETLPEEVPVIFSNDGFYRHCKAEKPITNSAESLILESLVKKTEQKYTVPYLYKIRKTSVEYRRLALLHPMAQWRVKEFYQKYEKLICHFCSQTKISIRAPFRVASSFYFRNAAESLNQYKRGHIHAENSDYKRRHASSFFAYHGYVRLHKFFSSDDFLRLEKKYSSLWSLDVSRCFDSIYTHTMAWATKEKAFTKANISGGVKLTFGNDFDELMQGANYNETNGIVIGPEVSRVFAEIILQYVDTRVLEKIENDEKWIHGRDYEVRRYVDDIHIFTSSEARTKRIFEIYTEQLLKFNLHVNNAKTLKHNRPFFTKKSQVIRETNSAINDFFDRFLQSDTSHERLIPGKVWKDDRLIKSFIDSIKSICITNQVLYDDVSAYIIGAFFGRIVRVIDVVEIEQEDVENYRKATLVLLEVLFFFYTTSPTVTASFQLSRSLVLLSRFAEKHMNDHKASINQKIYELTIQFFADAIENKQKKVETFLHLEVLNILLAVREIGDDYLIAEELVENLFDLSDQCSYFDIISCLYYVKGASSYSSILKKIIKVIDRKLKDMDSLSQRAEDACLFLDVISCPHIPFSYRADWLSKFCTKYGGTNPPNKNDQYQLLQAAPQNYWFVHWTEIDLLNMLERKELKRVY